jgi:hypothetical protein
MGLSQSRMTGLASERLNTEESGRLRHESASDSMSRVDGLRSDPSTHADRRRKAQSEVSRRVLDRCPHLPGPDRVLLELVFRDGRTVAEVAMLRAGRSAATGPADAGAVSAASDGVVGEKPLCEARRSAASLRRRVRRLVRRVLSREFVFVIHHRAGWTRSVRDVATACWIEGHSMRSAARHLSLSLHEVRRCHAAVSALLQMATV